MAITVNGKPDVPEPLPVVPRIGQVVMASSSSVTSVAGGGGWVNATGFSVTITPISATSKILILVALPCSFSNGGGTQYNTGFVGIARNGTTLIYSLIGQYYGSSTTGTHVVEMHQYSEQYVDAPATTSPITYTVQANNISNTPAMSVNSSGQASQIIAMEILV